MRLLALLQRLFLLLELPDLELLLLFQVHALLEALVFFPLLIRVEIADLLA